MKIVILDYNTDIVYVFPYDEILYEDGTDFFNSDYCKSRGILESNCEYMISNNLTLQIF
jgi:hypothetical protein